ncbi:uncharacterized protein LOC135826196 [Sycon ciliatum]|uniref:uncharacterized protein LOC135826196 n=1 Tax=Sycon ciliatum TaxID=27933 RepID=UPI0031F6E622
MASPLVPLIWAGLVCCWVLQFASIADAAVPNANADSEAPCDMSADYRDGSGVIYNVQKTDWNVSATVVFVPKGTKLGWSHATGVVDPSTWRIIMEFNYTSMNRTVRVWGTVKWQCSEIDFDNKAVWWRPDTTLTDIHLVYMTHLDVGFTDGARNVCDLYFNDHFPKAMRTAADLRRLSTEARFVYTEFPWLVHEYLTNAAGCAHTPRSEQQIADFTVAVQRGDISWHALSLNILTELYESKHFNWSLGIAETLNGMLGQKNGVLCGKHTDVPGMSRSVVPYLASRGVQALHIGYNGACMFPSIPSVFRWQHVASGTEVIVMAEPTYGERIRVDAAADTALVFMYTSDNAEPPSAAQVLAFWDALRARYPNAKINVERPLDAYTQLLASVKQDLPVISGEIGDSWLYGAPADPYRIAAYRTATSTINEAITAGDLDEASPYLEEYRYRLMKPMEHNWGLSVGQYLPQLRSTTHGNWSNAEFYAVRNRSDYHRLEREWQEQNEFCAPSSIRSTVLHSSSTDSTDRHGTEWLQFNRKLKTRLLALKNADTSRQPPYSSQHHHDNSNDRVQISERPKSTPYTCLGRFSVQFNITDGSMISLTDTLSKREWLGAPNGSMGVFRYRTYSMVDFDNFNRGYNPGCGPPCPDFSKSGMETANATSAVWMPRVVNFTAAVTGDDDACHFTATLSLPEETHAKYGAPRYLSLTYVITTSQHAPTSGSQQPVDDLHGNDIFHSHAQQRGQQQQHDDDTLVFSAGAGIDHSSGSDHIQVYTKLVWKDKPATRLAEAMFLSFAPVVRNASLWRMDVLGHDVSPLDVVVDGTRHLHAVGKGVRYAGVEEIIDIATLHTPLVAPGDIDHLLDYDGNTQPDLTGGWHFNLYNNLWGTAFPQWSNESGIAEFLVSFISTTNTTY